MSTAVTSRAGLNYHNSGTFEGLGAAGTGPSWEFMIRPIICPNPVPGGGEHQVGGGSPTKLGSPQGEGRDGDESSNRSSFFLFLGSIDLGWVQPFLKAIKSGRCSLDQSQDGGDGP